MELHDPGLELAQAPVSTQCKHQPIERTDPMGLFGKSRLQKPTEPLDAPPMGSGRRLRSKQDVEGCLANMELIIHTFRPPKYAYMPAYADAGWIWNGPEDETPTAVISFDDRDDKFLLATFRPESAGTEIGLFPLGSGDERLSPLSITGQWKQVDSSLSSIGTIPSRSITLAPPSFSDETFAEIVKTAGFAPLQANVAAVGRQFGVMSLIKAYEFINFEDPRGAGRFRDTHQYDGWSSASSFCQSVVDDLAGLDPGFLPYMQDFPMRFRAILLEDIDPTVGFWSELEQ